MANTKGSANTMYQHYLPTWQKMRDSVGSEKCIKEKAMAQNSATLKSDCKSGAPADFFSRYLIPTDSMIGDCKGAYRFSEYTFNATWYAYPLDTHDQSLGLINSQPAEIELPSSLEYMRNDCTSNQMSIESLLSKINSEQIVTSRFGMLLETTADRAEPFNICTYKAEAIVDHRVEINKVSGEEVVVWVKILTDECIGDKPIYLILRLDEQGVYIQYKTTNADEKYEEWDLTHSDVVANSFSVPEARAKANTIIPFVTVNLSELGLNQYQKPWLESVTDASFKAFQASAKYNWAIKWGGENTFWATGVGGKEAGDFVIGNGGACISESPDANFGYATAGSDGVAPSKDNLEQLKAYCVSLGVDLINQGVESGVALDTRMNVKTASLKTLAMTGAEGLERLLQIGNVWIGGKTDDVKIVANTEFAETKYTAEELLKIGQLVDIGKYRLEDLHSIYKKQGITTEEDFDQFKSDLDSMLVDTGHEVPVL